MTMTVERLRELGNDLDYDFVVQVPGVDNGPCKINQVTDDGNVHITWLTGGQAVCPIEGIRLTGELQWWEDRKIGETVHYHNSHGRWVRGEIVKNGLYKQFLPTELVGKWDGPVLLWDGSVRRDYHIDKVLKGEVMSPSSTNMYESGLAGQKVGASGRFHEDPSKMKAIDLSDPVPTPEQQRIIDRVKRLQDAVYVIDEVLVGLRNDFLEVQGLERLDNTL